MPPAARLDTSPTRERGTQPPHSLAVLDVALSSIAWENVAWLSRAVYENRGKTRLRKGSI